MVKPSLWLIVRWTRLLLTCPNTTVQEKNSLLIWDEHIDATNETENLNIEYCTVRMVVFAILSAFANKDDK